MINTNNDFHLITIHKDWKNWIIILPFKFSKIDIHFYYNIIKC